MSLFHDEEDGDPKEPVPGLPDTLPEGEALLWQGRPSARGFALHVFHIRLVIAYFVVMATFRVSSLAASDAGGAAMLEAGLSSLVTCVAAVALLAGLGWIMARSTIYSITSRRIVIRHGVAIRKYINLPFSRIESAGLKQHGKRIGDIALSVSKEGKPGFLHLWPHVRPFSLFRPEPMLRSVPEPQAAGDVLTKAIAQAAPDGVKVQKGGPQEAAKTAKTRSGEALPAGA